MAYVTWLVAKKESIKFDSVGGWDICETIELSWKDCDK